MDAVESMEDAIKRIKETLAKNEKEKTEMEDEIRKLKEELAKQEFRHQIAEEHIKHLLVKMEELREIYATKDNEIEKLKEQIKNHEESASNIMKKIQEEVNKNERLERLKKDKEKIEKLLKKEIEELEKDRTHFKSQVGNQKTLMEGYSSTLKIIRREKEYAKQQSEKEYKKLKEEKEKNEKQFAKDRTKLTLRNSELEATVKNKDKEHEAECKRLNETITKGTQQLNQYYAAYNKSVTEIAQLNADVQKLKVENQELQTYRNIYSEHKQQITSLRKTIQDLENQKEDLMLKLSRIDGANLSGLNPNMAYLSDEKRPTKLAEEFSELYDNEWTDAFEEFEAVDDILIKFLYDVLKRASEYCADLTTLHDEAIKSSFTTLKYASTVPITDDSEPNEATSNDAITTDKEEKQDHGKIVEISRVDFNFDDLSKEQLKIIMDLKKLFEVRQSTDVKSNGARIIANAMNVGEESEQMMKYILKCIDICWSMHRHEPPVHINFPSHVDGQSFDKNVYRPYTKSSKQLDFVVWPSLLLHKDGPMLSKGVAQGK